MERDKEATKTTRKGASRPRKPAGRASAGRKSSKRASGHPKGGADRSAKRASSGRIARATSASKGGAKRPQLSARPTSAERKGKPAKSFTFSKKLDAKKGA